MELIPRETFFPQWILYLLLVSVATLSVVKILRPAVFQHISATYVKPPSTIPNARENLSFAGKASWILLLNYFIVSGLTVFMTLLYFESENYWLIALPSVYYFIQVFTLFIAGWVSGESKKLSENFLLLNFTYQNIGLIYIPLLIIWLLNVDYSLFLIKTCTILFGLLMMLRFIRGFFFAIRNKVLWYYIILYLCTLEIWPLMLIYKLLVADLEG
ncbi:MAG: DUF4271 domain-containing protein [Brumimicrobium sp.]